MLQIRKHKKQTNKDCIFLLIIYWLYITATDLKKNPGDEKLVCMPSVNLLKPIWRSYLKRLDSQHYSNISPLKFKHFPISLSISHQVKEVIIAWNGHDHPPPLMFPSVDGGSRWTITRHLLQSSLFADHSFSKGW